MGLGIQILKTLKVKKMDRLQDWLTTLLAGIATLSAWIVKRLWSRLDKLEHRVDNINDNAITKRDLDKIIDIQHLILQNLLSDKKNVAPYINHTAKQSGEDS